jgi:hypothetical protein
MNPWHRSIAPHLAARRRTSPVCASSATTRGQSQPCTQQPGASMIRTPALEVTPSRNKRLSAQPLADHRSAQVCQPALHARPQHASALRVIYAAHLRSFPAPTCPVYAVSYVRLDRGRSGGQRIVAVERMTGLFVVSTSMHRDSYSTEYRCTTSYYTLNFVYCEVRYLFGIGPPASGSEIEAGGP